MDSVMLYSIEESDSLLVIVEILSSKDTLS